MTEAEFFQSIGGVPAVRAGTDPDDPGGLAWNFGVADPEVQPPQTAPGFHATFPKLAGKWDGKTINQHNAVKKVRGDFLPAHLQPRGTCGGRAASRTMEHLQCVLIAAGKRAKFHYVSHAWPYYLARKDAGMLRGGDGVPNGSIPAVLAKYGSLTRAECGDASWAGGSSDDLACSLGVSKSVPDDWFRLAADNKVTAHVRAHSAAELADALASGGVGCQSDTQGFEMTRDDEGVCRPRGTWYHYHTHPGIVVLPSGRKVFIYDQSWGENSPQGPRLAGCPGNSFGVDWDVMDYNCKNGYMHVLFQFPLWDLENDTIPPDWSFV